MRTLGIVSEDTTYSPVVSRVSGWEWRMRDMRNQGNVAVANSAIGDRHLALRQPKGISLPANDSTVLLLKALSIRLAGKHLVTTVIQCSEFYEVDEDGKRSDPGNDLVSDSVEPSIEAGMLTPLYTIATPQVWRRHLACAQRKERFKSIREHFYALVNMRQLAGTELHRKSNKRKKDRAIKFFSDLLPSMIETDSLSDSSVGTAEADSLLPHPSTLTCTNWVMICNLFNRRQQSNADEDSRLEVVLPLLRRRCQTLCAEDDAPRQYADEKKKVVREVESILQTLGSGLLGHIADTFQNAPFEQALQAKLNETVDEDEQRALEEDVTGKILWFCWCGICAEVDELLPKVVDYLRREADMGGLLDLHFTIISTTGTDPGDDQTHLQRIMHDAGAGTSKHQLLLVARDAEQTKWSGTHGGIAAVENEGTMSSTSSQTPSIPVVWQTRVLTHSSK
ncbi:hypothetical protein EDC04DRAFT_1013944 [Pisolithus marmoratus]|nr:hypothetical protein EDC04DRAFT_1013944 [Pisolithus marmoratus]